MTSFNNLIEKGKIRHKRRRREMRRIYEESKNEIEEIELFTPTEKMIIRISSGIFILGFLFNFMGVLVIIEPVIAMFITFCLSLHWIVITTLLKKKEEEIRKNRK